MALFTQSSSFFPQMIWNLFSKIIMFLISNCVCWLTYSASSTEHNGILAMCNLPGIPNRNFFECNFWKNKKLCVFYENMKYFTCRISIAFRLWKNTIVFRLRCFSVLWWNRKFLDWFLFALLRLVAKGKQNLPSLVFLLDCAVEPVNFFSMTFWKVLNLNFFTLKPVLLVDEQ